MNNMNTLIISILLASSGIIMLTYYKLSQKFIFIFIKRNLNKGIDMKDKKHSEYFAKYFNTWKSGKIFSSNTGIYLGIIALIASYLLNQLNNSVEVSILTILASILISLIIIYMLRWRAQAVPLIFVFAAILIFLIS